MKRLLILLLCTCMLCCACGKESNDTLDISDITPLLPEYTLVFDNDGMHLTLTREQLNNALDGRHRNTDMIAASLEQGEEYYATLEKVQIGVYNLDNREDTGVSTTLTPNASLLTDEDITVSTTKFEKGPITYVGAKYPIERLHQMLRLGFENYGTYITCFCKVGYGDSVSSKFSFRLIGRMRFKNNSDLAFLPSADLTLLDDGAELILRYDDILDEFDIEDSALPVSVSTISTELYSSLHKRSVISMEYLCYEYAADEHPETITFRLKYDRARENNEALMAEYRTVGQEMYAELTLTLELGETEYTCTYFIRCIVHDGRDGIINML